MEPTSPNAPLPSLARGFLAAYGFTGGGKEANYSRWHLPMDAVWLAGLTEALLSVYEQQAQANQSTGEAAKSTWFVPNTPNWANVESGNVLQNALESIATGKSTTQDAAKSADAQIAQILNAGS